eukprot:scaffold36454_cov68-Phaeocystis_antarctica.AAC.22
MAPSPPPAGLRSPKVSDCKLSELGPATAMTVMSASMRGRRVGPGSRETEPNEVWDGCVVIPCEGTAQE